MIEIKAIVKALDVNFTEEHDGKSHNMGIKISNRRANRKDYDPPFWINVYGNYAKSLHDNNVVQPGDKLVVSAELTYVEYVDKNNGKTITTTRWNNVNILDSTTPQNTAPAPSAAVTDGLDPDTF